METMKLEEKIQAFRNEYPAVVEVETKVVGAQVVITASTEGVTFTECGEVDATLAKIGGLLKKDAAWVLKCKGGR